MPLYQYDFDGFSFTLEIPIYWSTIYKGKPRERLYGCYTIVLDQLQKMSKDKIVLDVGVNHGIFSVPCALMGYKVIGFEPVKENYYGAGINMASNDCKDWQLFNYALSNENVRREIYVPECPDNASLNKDAAIMNMKRKEYRVELVDAIKFDDWIKEHPEYSNIGFIKIDTQGAEFDVVEGMREFLINATDIYLIAEYEKLLNLMGHTYEQLDELIKSFGFEKIGNITGGDHLFYKP